MGTSETQEGASAEALAQLRELAGEWEGSFEWTGARTRFLISTSRQND
jgi:hypothetical protein